ncbi:hypothetical protein GUITHDRAFT_150878 [Guillardia theta CCMP2712]|uniref:Uncharacterized protein n=2 Tax=Guillardia theta TaxID=55529 RepID=L1JB77_GUITC|nr:hypothetical protein GUITHDRAFT_152690 [Guillardia theta CCMP2712]XP_005838342.1 hypothetical protein GUITHDRAFT_150878 [Guillardia theta CCMP2712]EKX45340.1 hypothetical protein GUITHDRAFT_152690 [Guillardia theta CCMP2712]EKX51362.1 hypothetical protein GUITHDRAFT_150878 [Guillardia theta CCMP2712]|eukprot:XP_005832320.1 hypothetical protein GUITHDRAFT_152690 [Guillardia theta CCMP2712]
MERIPNRMERREDGQERAGDLQATQASEDARLQERLEDEQEQGGQGSTKLIAATVLQLQWATGAEEQILPAGSKPPTKCQWMQSICAETHPRIPSVHDERCRGGEKG